MGSSTKVCSRMVILLSLLWMSQFPSVWATIGRYGGSAFRRPVLSQPVSYGRPNQPYPGQLIASPTHAYSILAKPPNVFKQPPQFQQPQPQFQQPQPQFQQQQQPQFQQQQPHFQHQPQFQPQPIRYQNQPQPIRFPPQQPQHQKQQLYVQTPVQYYQPAASNQYQQTSGYYSYQTPTAFTVHSNSRPSQVHYHVHAAPTQPQKAQVSSDSITSGSSQVLSYEGCTQSHWQPVQGSSSISTSASSTSYATAPSSQQPSYFYGASVSPSSSFSSANTRAQNLQSLSSNKVVVLSHDVLKTLLANSNNKVSATTPVQSKPVQFSDSVGSASSQSHVVVSGNNVVSNSIADQPSVKLVGYIGPTSSNTPTGYIQIPINKNVMDGLSGPQTSYDFAMNSTNYSLFTLKSVNDVQSILSTMKGGDQDASASQPIPLGLVISNEPKSNQAAISNEPLFYSSAASSPVASVTTTTGEAVANPSIQMVGHVQITSPDVSSHFVKRKDDDEKITISS